MLIITPKEAIGSVFLQLNDKQKQYGCDQRSRTAGRFHRDRAAKFCPEIVVGKYTNKMFE
jgi:hypothetical protein